MRAYLILMTAAVLFSAAAFAEIPHQISYQGRLTDNAGQGITGTENISFALYADSSTATLLWEENHAGVVLTDGLFSVMLGSVSALVPSIFDGSVRYLLVTVDGQAFDELIPVVSVAHSYRSISSDTAQYAVTAGNTISSVWEQTTSTVYLPDVTDNVGIGTTTPEERLHVVGNFRMEEACELQFGSGDTKLRGSGGDLSLSADIDLFLQSKGKIYLGQYGSPAGSAVDPVNMKVGFGTTSPEELLHLYNEDADGTAFMKIQTNHLSNWSEAGLRIETPENRWHLRMDDPSHNNINEGAISLRSQDINDEVMVWEPDGKVGIGLRTPEEKLHVNGNAKVSGSFNASQITGDYAANSIGRNDILDEVGIASRHASDTVHLDWDEPITVLSRTLTVPTAGYILAFGSAYALHANALYSYAYFRLGLTVQEDSLNDAYTSECLIDLETAIRLTIPYQRLFHAASAGTYTIYLLGQGGSTGPHYILDRQLDLLFIPTVYSSKDGATEADGDIAQITPSQLISASNRYGGVSPEALADEIADLKRRLSKLEGE